MVACSRSPSRCRALAISSRTSLTVAVTALSCTNDLAVERATTRASVVLPVPAGPHNTTDESRSASIRRRSGLPWPSRCFWPTMSSSRIGRMRDASGWRRSSRCSAAAANRSSLMACCSPLPSVADGSDAQSPRRLRPRGSSSAVVSTVTKPHGLQPYAVRPLFASMMRRRDERERFLSYQYRSCRDQVLNKMVPGELCTSTRPCSIGDPHFEQFIGVPRSPLLPAPIV